MKKRIAASLLAMCFVAATGVAYAAPVDAPKFTIGGETRFRLVSDDPASGVGLEGGQQYEFRQRIKFSGVINETMNFTGRLATSGGSKFGSADPVGNAIELDIMNVTAKDAMGLDSVRIGRSALDFYTNGLIGKPMNVDGILLTDTIGNMQLKAWTGNVAVNTTTGDSSQLTTVQAGWKAAQDLNFKVGAYSADIAGTGYTGSTGWNISGDYKLAQYTVLFDYVSTALDNATIDDSPTGWVVQVSNSKGPKVLYPAVPLVSVAQKGQDAWMVSYRSVKAGATPAGGFDTTAVANKDTTTTGMYPFATNDVNAWYAAYQNVVAKNVLFSVEYQDLKRESNGNDLNKTLQAKMEFFY